MNRERVLNLENDAKEWEIYRRGDVSKKERILSDMAPRGEGRIGFPVLASVMSIFCLGLAIVMAPFVVSVLDVVAMSVFASGSGVYAITAGALAVGIIWEKKNKEKYKDKSMLYAIEELSKCEREECLKLKDLIEEMSKKGEVYDLSLIKDEVNDIEWVSGRIIENFKVVKNENYKRDLGGRIALLKIKVDQLEREMGKENVDLGNVIEKLDEVKDVSRNLLRYLERYGKDKGKEPEYNLRDESQYDVQMKSMEELEKEEAGPSHEIKNDTKMKDIDMFVASSGLNEREIKNDTNMKDPSTNKIREGKQKEDRQK